MLLVCFPSCWALLLLGFFPSSAGVGFFLGLLLSGGAPPGVGFAASLPRLVWLCGPGPPSLVAFSRFPWLFGLPGVLLFGRAGSAPLAVLVVACRLVGVLCGPRGVAGFRKSVFPVNSE